MRGGPLIGLGDRLRQPAILVGDDKHHAFEATTLQPTEGLVPGRETLAVANLHAENLPMSVAPDARKDQGGPLDNTVVLTALEKQGVGQKEGGVARQPPLVERPYAHVQPRAQRLLRAARREGDYGGAGRSQGIGQPRSRAG